MILSLLATVKNAVDAYKAVTGLIKGDPNTQLLEELVKHNRAISSGIERLSDTILYAPNMQAVQDINRRSNPRQVDGREVDGREVREYLEPVQRALKQPILSSAVILTPEKMRQAMFHNPFDVLIDVRPVDFFTARLPPEGVPVQFEHSGVRYMGWQLRGTLPMLFDCEVQDLFSGNTAQGSTIIITPQPIIQPPPLVTKPQTAPADVRHGHYLIHPNGTVTDTRNGLMWKRCAEGQTCVGQTCVGSGKWMKWNEIMQAGWFFNKQKPWPAFAGYNDWRVPTIEELRTIVYCSSGEPKTWNDHNAKVFCCKGNYQQPTIDTTAFPNTENVGFWSFSAVASDSSKAWLLNFTIGYDFWYPRSNEGRVRLVRGGQ